MEQQTWSNRTLDIRSVLNHLALLCRLHQDDAARPQARSRSRLGCLLPLLLCAAGATQAAEDDAGAWDFPKVVIEGLPAPLLTDDSGSASLSVRVDGKALPRDEDGAIRYRASSSGWQRFELYEGEQLRATKQHYVLPGWLTITPPLIAFILALVLREVIPALFVALWLGTFIVLGPSLGNIVPGLLQAASVYGVAAVSDEGHAMLIIFTLMVGGLVAILSRSGGTQGIVNQIVTWANNRHRGQTATASMGLAIFFDDYANTLILGKTMRPVTDALRISREKLAYLVDSTAAPVSTLAIISSWIGFQVGLIDEAIAHLPDFTVGAYAVFVNSLAYNYYPILTLLLVVLVATSGRDFGPMRQAEERAASTGALFSEGARIGDSTELAALDPKAGITPRAINAYLPLGVLVSGVIGALYLTGAESVGWDASLMTIIGASDSYVAMIWATLGAIVVALGMTLSQGILSLAEAMETWIVGAKTMLLALVVLVLAWALAGVNETLQTAEWLSATLGDQIPVQLLPPIIFLLAAVIAIATGTSWGVMGILIPLVIPLAWNAAVLQGTADPEKILFAATSSVLAGAVMGDHCSPLADTSILTASSTSCDLIDHIRTQLPYALLTASVALGAGLLPALYGLPWWAALLLSAAVLTALFRWLTRNNPPLR